MQLATGHIGSNVSDRARSVDFYRRALGFEQLSAETDGARRWAFHAPAPAGSAPTRGFF
ncbi:VOC family protein [Nocardia asteroides]|uniref:VOC family protein n=1 Tax=Nocardia asteroides TaxID=1824 RepID=UPI001E41F5E2|nr:VOC family protein [Nocardia asteroides]UGT61369.1 VOC family protein [Nocardia asteroides]